MKKAGSISEEIDNHLKTVFLKSDHPSSLVVAENHEFTNHINWISDHIEEMRDNYDVSTISVEFAPFQNIFIWAYNDGTLAKVLGGEKEAGEYLRMALQSLVQPQDMENADAMANLAIKCKAAKVDFIAHDARHSFKQYKKLFYDSVKNSEELNPIMDMIESKSDGFFQFMRSDLRQHSWMMEPGSETERVLWGLNEVDWLLKENPNYKSKFQSIENLVDKGLAIINKKSAPGSISSDGLSACLLNALAKPNGNRLIVSGIGHVDGVGESMFVDQTGKESERTEGAFANHLFSVCNKDVQREHKVNCAVIAGTGDAKRMQHLTNFRAFTSDGGIKVPKITHLNIETGNVDEFKYDKRLNRMNDFKDLAPVYHKTSKKQADDHEQFANPLLIPEIKRLSDAIEQEFHPEKKLLIK